MNTLYSLTYRNLKLNKKRTIVTMIGIILSVALICAVAGMVTSFQRSLYKEAIEDGGNYHTIFKDVPIKEANVISEHREIKETFTFSSLGYALLSDNEEDIKYLNRPYFRLVGFSSNTIGNYPLPLTSGRLPENSNEIVLSADLAFEYSEQKIGNKSLKVGDKITLDIGTRVNADGDILDNSNPLVIDDYTECIDNSCEVHSSTKDYREEKIIDTKTKEYTIVGIFDYGMNYNFGDYHTPAYDIYTLLDSNVEASSVDLYIQYKNAKNYKELNDELNPKVMSETGIETRIYGLENNDYLLDTMGVGFSDNTRRVLYTMVAIVIGIIMVASVFVIKNGFSISIVERYKQFGMLSSVGATSKQIRRSVLFEGLLLGMIAIPIGILCGILAVFILVNLVNLILKDFVDHDMIIFYITSLPIIVAIITSIITIFLSCYLPARRASKQSIIDLIRSNNSIKMKSKKLKTPRYITKLFGVGGEIAHKNLKRNKKKYRTTVVSLVVSIVIFISLNAFINTVFDSSTYYFNSVDYDLSIYYYLPRNEDTTQEEIRKILNDKTRELLSLGNPGEYAIMKSDQFVNRDFKIYTDDYINVYRSMGGFSTDEEGNMQTYISMTAVGKEEFERLVNKIGGKVEDYQDGAILIDDIFIYDNELEKYREINVLNLKENDTLKLINIFDGEEREIEIPILTRTNERILGMPNHRESYSGALLVVSDEYFDKITDGNMINSIEILMKTNDVDNIAKQLDKLKENDTNIGYSNIHEAVRQQRAMVLIVSIFLYGFIAVITLIGVTNIFNTITTNMALRSREFAMLKAIGMTNKEFNRMIRLESVLYGLKSLLIGIPIGVLLAYIIHSALGRLLDTAFVLPINAILISILFVFIIVYMTMRYSLKKINKQNIIETIREENI